jgi:hypothetical protein
VNQLGAELIFKGGDLFTDGRLTDSTFLCDSEKLPFSTTRAKICIAFEFVHDTLPITLCNPFYTGDGDSVGAVRIFD